MKITTMLNAMEMARIRAVWHYLNPNKYQRQYHAFRDGIHRRWIRMEIAHKMAEGRAEFWEREAKADADAPV